METLSAAYLTALHATRTRLVFAFAGAGAQALMALHSVGGSSRTVLEAVDCYSSHSLSDWLGYQPEKSVSASVARQMAWRAFRRASRLAGPFERVIGVACTATIATDRRKRGQHRACISLWEATGETRWAVQLVKGRRTRQEEEALVSSLVLAVIGRACGVGPVLQLGLQADEPLQIKYRPHTLLETFEGGGLRYVLLTETGEQRTGGPLNQIGLFSGSFNPLHQGHRDLQATAEAKLGHPVYFELPTHNADKAAISLAETERRLKQFLGIAPIIVTRTPLFTQKAKLFPNSVFVVGFDTAERIIDPRFYDNNPASMRQALEAIREAGCSFLVAGRALPSESDTQFRTLDELNLPSAWRDLFEAIPESDFRRDISSTQLRAGD